jgi:hypothetical protein
MPGYFFKVLIDLRVLKTNLAIKVPTYYPYIRIKAKSFSFSY